MNRLYTRLILWLAFAVLATLVLAVNHVCLPLPGSGPVDAPTIANFTAFLFDCSGTTTAPADDWIEEWVFRREIPFRYRILGNLPIYFTYRLLAPVADEASGMLFYNVYVFWTFVYVVLFFATASACVSATTRCLTNTCSDPNLILRLAAAGILVLMPPVLFAFKFPVQGSANDFLGYVLIAAAMLTILRQQFWRMILCCILGIMCRETVFVVLAPYWLISIDSPRRKAATIASLLFGLVLYRTSFPGSYDPFFGGRHNMNFPAESLAFFFLVFGPVWYLAGAQLFHNLFRRRDTLIRQLDWSLIICTITTAGICLVLTRIREIRIEFSLFFLVVPYALTRVISWRDNPRMPILFRLLALAMGAFAASLTHTAFELEKARDRAALFERFAHFACGFGGGWTAIFSVALGALVVVVLVDLMPLIPAFRQSNPADSGHPAA